ncbi:hypothetical protein M0R36_09955 [bacterium]|jgi:hypothetical protein|nr:hypothetical protein [bacterium]
MRVLITVEGGLIQNIISDQADTEVLIIDYDGNEMNVPQDNGMTSEAWVADRDAHHNKEEVDKYFDWYENEKCNTEKNFLNTISDEMDDIVSVMGEK